MRRAIFSLLLIVPPALCSAQEGIPDQEIWPYVVLTGADSQITESEYHRVLSEEEWANLWYRHIGKEPPETNRLPSDPGGIPVVDFSQCMVVAIFHGSGWNSLGLKTVSLTESEDQLVLRYSDLCYQTGPDPDPVRVYGFFVIPRRSQALIVEEKMWYTVAGQSLRWREKARFEELQEPVE